MTVDDLDRHLQEILGDEGRRWLDDAVAAVHDEPSRVRTLFPAVGRNVGREVLPGEDPGEVTAWTADDAARGVLLDALGDAAAEEVPGLFRHGDADEQRAIVRCLHLLPQIEEAEAMALHAIRSNDPRLVAAALGRWGREHLDDEEVAQAALKCVFYGVSLDSIDGLRRRATPRLGQMLADFAHERIAAGRSVPEDIWPIIDRHAPPEAVAAIEAEVDHEDADRRAAAREALAGRDRQER